MLSPSLFELERLSQLARSDPRPLLSHFEDAALTLFTPVELIAARELPLWSAARSICDLADRLAQNAPTPAYHNPFHFADALHAMSALARAEIGERPVSERLLALLIMAGHDLFHDGTRNDPASGKNLELISAQAVDAAMESAGACELHRRLAFETILRTDPQRLEENRRLYETASPEAPEFEQTLARLAALACDADTLNSLLPRPGSERGAELAQEWSSFDPEAARRVATDEGRRYFLNHNQPITRAAASLGLERCRQDQLRALALAPQPPAAPPRAFK